MVAKRLLEDEGVRFDMAFSSDSDRASDVSLPGDSVSQSRLFSAETNSR